jgi:hypothetical protein
VAEEYRIRYRDLDGREQLSLAKPSPADAIHHARVIALHRGTILAMVEPEGEVSWNEVLVAAEAAGRRGRPPRSSGAHPSPGAALLL